MMVTDSISNIPQQILKSEAKVVPEEKVVEPQDEKSPKIALERKSIFADHRGVLIAQIKDHTGAVVANYPSNEVIKRYHLMKEN